MPFEMNYDIRMIQHMIDKDMLQHDQQRTKRMFFLIALLERKPIYKNLIEFTVLLVNS